MTIFDFVRFIDGALFCFAVLLCQYFSHTDPSRILGSVGKQITAKAGARGHENCCTFQ